MTLAEHRNPIDADAFLRDAELAAERLSAVEAWSALRQAQGKPRVRIGIGGHYGEVFIGVVGNERMLEFTVLGDAVNVAERLERLTRAIDATFVVSRALLDAADPSQATAWMPVPQSRIAGVLAGHDVFSLRTDAWRQRAEIRTHDTRAMRSETANSGGRLP